MGDELLLHRSVDVNPNLIACRHILAIVELLGLYEDGVCDDPPLRTQEQGVLGGVGAGNVIGGDSLEEGMGVLAGELKECPIGEVSLVGQSELTSEEVFNFIH